MREQIVLGLLAVGIGAVTGVALFVPFIAVSYRRRGRLSMGRTALWVSALIYFWAIWAYTLLPLPDPHQVTCAGVNLDPAAFLTDIGGAIARRGNTLTDPAVLQLVLNIALFVPLGFLIRVLGRRGVVVSLIAGAAISALIEFTQLTGIWGLYPCAYRVFDVDDLITNTLGAVLGSWAALLVAHRRGRTRLPQRPWAPRTVTRRRRAVAILCDIVSVTVAYFVVAVLVQVALQLTGNRALVLSGQLSTTVATAVVFGGVLALTLARGQTVGDYAVEIRFRASRLPLLAARALRFVGGIGGYLLLQLLPDGYGFLTWVFVLVTVILFFATSHGRGLPGLLSGQFPVDAREPTTDGSERAAAPL